MTPQLDFQEMLRRRRLAELAQQQSSANADVSNEPQPQIQPIQPTQIPLETRAILPNQAPQAPIDPYQEFLKTPAPDISKYHPSKGRRIAAVALGALAGAGGRPEAGEKFLYEPFSRQLATYQSKAERLKAGAAEEERLAKTTAEKERAGAEEARRKGEEFKTSPEAHKQKLEEIEAGKEIPLEKDLFDLELQDGSKVQGARFQIRDGKGQYVGPDNRIFGPGSIKSASKQGNPAQMKFSNAFEAEYSNYLQTHNYQTPPSDWIEATTTRLAQASGLFGVRKGQEELAGARAEQARVSASLTKKRAEDATSVEIQQARDFLEKHPEQYGDYVKQFSDIKRRSLLREVPPIALVKGQEQTRVANAHTALLHANTVRNLIEDPFIKANLGPILGRIDLASSSFGGNPVGSTPEEAEKEQEFLSFLTANLLWETTSGVGTRPARQTIELIKRTAPRASETYERVKGALDAQEKSAQNVVEGIIYGGKKPKEPIKEGLSDFKEVTQ